MIRTLDLASLRSFSTVAEVGGVTRAAGFLNPTQSAVSMQIRRPEASLGLALFLRCGRRQTPTPGGRAASVLRPADAAAERDGCICNWQTKGHCSCVLHGILRNTHKASGTVAKRAMRERGPSDTDCCATV